MYHLEQLGCTKAYIQHCDRKMRQRCDSRPCSQLRYFEADPQFPVHVMMQKHPQKFYPIRFISCSDLPGITINARNFQSALRTQQRGSSLEDRLSYNAAKKLDRVALSAIRLTMRSEHALNITVASISKTTTSSRAQETTS
jgi:hypothetical protein